MNTEPTKIEMFTEKAKFILELIKLFAEMHWGKIVIITAAIIALFWAGVI